MGRNVLLLYMSIFNKNPKIRTQTQTNEGAVRYLIKEKETPDCILALCSETVRKKAVVEMPDGSTCTTLEYFRDALRRVGIPEERLVVIEVPDSMDDEKKQFQAISQLLEKIEKRGMTTEGMEQYMDTFKHGMPPHGGLGIGLERLTMKLIGEDNVRETTLFPRDMSRLEP